MAIVMPQTSKTQTNVVSAQKTVTFNTASNSTSNVQEKTAPAVQAQATKTANNEATVKPQQQPVASQSVAQRSAKAISTSPASEQNVSVRQPAAEKQTVIQPRTKPTLQQNNFATTSQTTPKEVFHQTVTFHDDVTGASKTVITQINGNKGNEYDVYNTDLSLPNGYYLDCSNIAKGNPNTITQDNEKFNYNIVNPYNVVKGDFNTDIGSLNGKNFPVGNQLYDNSITHPTIPMIAPGVGSWDLMKIMFVDQNGKQVGTQTVDPNNYKDIENDWADYAFKVTAPNGYKFVDPRENFVAFTRPLGRGTNAAKMQNGYMVYPVKVSNIVNNKDNNGSNISKPATGTATNKPATGSNTNPSKSNGSASTGANKPVSSNTNGSTNNKPSGSTQPSSITKPAGTTEKAADSSTNKPSGSSNTNSSKPTNSTTSVNTNKSTIGSGINGNKSTTNLNNNGNNSTTGSSATSANKPANNSSTANTNKPITGSNGTNSSQATNDSTSTNTNKSANTSSSSAEQPIKVTVHYVGQDGKIVDTVIDTIQPESTLDVSRNVPQGYEVSSAFKPQTDVQANNDQATLNVPVVPVGKNEKTNQANDKGPVNNVPNNQAGKKNIVQTSNVSNVQKGNDKQKATNSIQAQGKGNQQSLHVNDDRNVGEGADGQNTSANGNVVPTFNVAGNASQAAFITQVTGNGQSGVQENTSTSIVQNNQASSASTSNSGSSVNTLPETGMSNEGIIFAAAMIALAGIATIKRKHEE